MTYDPERIREVHRRLDKVTPTDDEAGIAIAAITLQAEEVAKERKFLEALIKSGHKSGVSKRGLAAAAGINRKTVERLLQAS